jgi:prephenate dehydrogenase
MRLALIGVGLIGGSFAKALRAAGKVDAVVGFDSQVEALARAVELGVIDERATSAEKAVEQANLIVIATPVGSTPDILRAIAPHLQGAAVVTDVGSTKASVITEARRELGAAFERFVPGHPIAGREQSGIEHADATLFRDKMFISTPVAQTKAGAVHEVEALWREVGCRVERMTPEEHDNVFAAVSHLPHLLAFALVAQIAADPDAGRKFALAGAGFRDFTRIAASSPVLWSDVCVANRGALSDELRQHRDLLGELQRAIDECDTETLQSVFSRARAALA